MSNLLDDEKYVRSVDRGGMLKVLERFPDMCREAVVQAKEFEIDFGKRFKNVVVAGMGGSAIGGILLRDWLADRSPLPIIVSRDYHLPAFVDERSLVILVSYSGNTEETLSAYREAAERECMRVVLSSGGELLGLAEEEGITVMRLPVGYQPRVSLPYQFFNLVILASKCGLVEGFNMEVSETLDLLSVLSEEYRSSTAVNPAKKLAMELEGYVPFVYGPKLYEGVAYRLGTQLNENSKVPASSGFFPEVFHNVVMGSEAPHQVLNKVCVALIRDPMEERAYAGKLATFKELFTARGVKVIELGARGKERLSRMMSILFLGDYVSAYLALLYGKDPSTVNAISRIKQRN